ncbi:MAG: hypothetical protein JNK53_07475, partial [Phycisphaerae bacterium]|nr:hypothetical protein [Phycisphaerae bacterium]
ALTSEGVSFDLLGVPILMGEPTRGRSSRDVMQIASVLDRFTARKEIPPVIVTALGAPSSDGGEGAGWWRGHWSPPVQRDFATTAFQTALANPGVAAVVWDRLRDGAGSGASEGGLFASDGTPKASADRLLRLRMRLRTPIGALDGGGLPADGVPTDGTPADEASAPNAAMVGDDRPSSEPDSKA